MAHEDELALLDALRGHAGWIRDSERDKRAAAAAAAGRLAEAVGAAHQIVNGADRHTDSHSSLTLVRSGYGVDAGIFNEALDRQLRRVLGIIDFSS